MVLGSTPSLATTTRNLPGVNGRQHKRLNFSVAFFKLDDESWTLSTGSRYWSSLWPRFYSTNALHNVSCITVMDAELPSSNIRISFVGCILLRNVHVRISQIIYQQSQLRVLHLCYYISLYHYMFRPLRAIIRWIQYIVLYCEYCYYIVTISLSITTCFGPYGPSSGEYNILYCIVNIVIILLLYLSVSLHVSAPTGHHQVNAIYCNVLWILLLYYYYISLYHNMFRPLRAIIRWIQYIVLYCIVNIITWWWPVGAETCWVTERYSNINKELSVAIAGICLKDSYVCISSICILRELIS
jgi:hypothetical protein